MWTGRTYQECHGQMNGHIFQSLKNPVKTALDHKAMEFTAIITIDISGAFDNAWWPIVLKIIDEDNINASIVKLFRSYFDNRKIRYRYPFN
ncbi:hypothetical protein LAZ67_5002279 [Cordylochernes scorpioides]|uniref:Reverse transcriptase domain-containing protein n=1 Tax=Cordylochernes scorpioides TaxID=51811 RepID=A0ABY6KL28_9ARAC|nr:hypothetical protein LAZ67_5002279 [Cordylochernes scorpioides]